MSIKHGPKRKSERLTRDKFQVAADNAELKVAQLNADTRSRCIS